MCAECKVYRFLVIWVYFGFPLVNDANPGAVAFGSARDAVLSHTWRLRFLLQLTGFVSFEAKTVGLCILQYRSFVA